MKVARMKNKTGISSQFLIALGIVLAIGSKANASITEQDFPKSFKVEKCDCVGISDDIPTFLSDLAGGAIEIFGEGPTREAAEQQARNMCVENYPQFASVSLRDDLTVTESGCHVFESTPDGDWEAI